MKKKKKKTYKSERKDNVSIFVFETSNRINAEQSN